MQNIGDELRMLNGENFIVKKIIEKINKDKGQSRGGVLKLPFFVA